MDPTEYPATTWIYQSSGSANAIVGENHGGAELESITEKTASEMYRSTTNDHAACPPDEEVYRYTGVITDGGRYGTPIDSQMKHAAIHHVVVQPARDRGEFPAVHDRGGDHCSNLGAVSDPARGSKVRGMEDTGYGRAEEAPVVLCPAVSSGRAGRRQAVVYRQADVLAASHESP
ncbi:hypothetical protein C8Q80DRAFT_1266293 [Daedaleopsis nitida]|nr:hypothetical protein C8Q80DRAFT_1266293 [Daedaleopsis nitida]